MQIIQMKADNTDETKSTPEDRDSCVHIGFIRLHSTVYVDRQIIQMKPNPRQRDGDGRQNQSNEQGAQDDQGTNESSDEWNEPVCMPCISAGMLP